MFKKLDIRKYPVLKNILIAILFGVLSKLFSHVKLQIPGSLFASSNLREIPLIISIIFLPNWTYTIIVAFITCVIGTTVLGAFFATLTIHLAAVLVAWFVFHIIDAKIKNNIVFSIFWIVFIFLLYQIVFLPLFIVTYSYIGSWHSESFFISMITLSRSLTFEIITTALVSTLFIVIVRINKNLQEQIKWHDLIIRQTNIGFWSRNLKENTVKYHEQWANMLGYSIDEVQSNAEIWKSLLHPDDREKAFDAFQKLVNGDAEYYYCEYRMKTKSGEWKWILDKGQATEKDKDGKIIQIAGTHLDITDTVKMQEMMIQNEKMLSIGGLAAGMAHEINNPLAGMMQNASVIVNRLTKPSPKNLELAEKLGLDYDKLMQYLEDRKIIKMATLILETGQRAADIIQNMLSFARKSESNFKEVDIREIIDDTIKLVENDFDMKKHYDFRKMEIVRNYQETLPAIMIQDTKIKQVIMNILKNGAEAVVENKIATNNDEQSRFTINIFLEKRFIRIEIENNGPPIPNEIKKRIFEPFFTTKGEGKGTGLGLSISYFIITKDHGGEMYVESDASFGTRFVVKLPVK